MLDELLIAEARGTEPARADVIRRSTRGRGETSSAEGKKRRTSINFGQPTNQPLAPHHCLKTAPYYRSIQDPPTTLSPFTLKAGNLTLKIFRWFLFTFTCLDVVVCYLAMRFAPVKMGRVVSLNQHCHRKFLRPLQPLPGVWSDSDLREASWFLAEFEGRMAQVSDSQLWSRQRGTNRAELFEADIRGTSISCQESADSERGDGSRRRLV